MKQVISILLVFHSNYLEIQIRAFELNMHPESIILTWCVCDYSTVQKALGGSGIVLCVFGLLYGGYWRIQIRKRFHLPASTWCCGQPNMTDCTQWFFCSLCSLCQEVRTAEAFNVVDDKFYHKEHPRPHSPGHEDKKSAPDVLLNPVPASEVKPHPETDVEKLHHPERTQQTTLTPPPTQHVEA